MEDSESLDESFENVSVPSFLSSIQFDRPAAPPSGPRSQRQPPMFPLRPTPPCPKLHEQFCLAGLFDLIRLPNPRACPPRAAPPSQARAAPLRHHPSHPLAAPHPPPCSRPPSARISVQSTATTAQDRASILSQGTTTFRTTTSSCASVSSVTAIHD
jgi:hypothetical protein